jgi:hypothetical protein
MLPPQTAAVPTPPDSVHYQADQVESHSRLTTFFRFFLAIPHFILLYVYGLVAGIAVIIAWFAIVFTARYPEGLYNFVAGFERYYARVYAYAYLLADPYPPFSGGEHPEYPVRLLIGPPKEQYSRLLTFFRIFLLIPVAIINYVMMLLAGVIAFIAWFVILVIGRLPDGLFKPLAFGLSYGARAGVYGALLTERFPSFDDAPNSEVSFAPPAPGTPPAYAPPTTPGDTTPGS